MTAAIYLKLNFSLKISDVKFVLTDESTKQNNQ